MTWNDNDDPNAQWRRPDQSAPPAAPPPPPGGPSTPPPPPPFSGGGPPPPPSGAFGAAPGYGVPAPYGSAPFAAGKPPRPAIPVAGWLMVAGAVLILVGTFIPWKTYGGQSINGFDEYIAVTDEGLLRQTPGGIFVFFALVLLAFGITALTARRVLAVVIIAIVVASGVALFSAGELAIYGDTDNFYGGGDLSAGIPVMLVGSLVALGGAITGCAKRRR